MCIVIDGVGNLYQVFYANFYASPWECVSIIVALVGLLSIFYVSECPG